MGKSGTEKEPFLQKIVSFPFRKKRREGVIPFDPEKEYAVIRSSICTGEKAAGFKDRETGHFKEVMLLRTEEDEKRFKKIYGIEKIVKEY